MAKKRSIWIAIPAYTGQVHLGTMRSVVADLLTLAKRGDSVSIFDECGNALIGDCRAQIVAQFLATPGTTDLIMVDSDVMWQRDGLVRLVDHPVDFVAGLYPKRSDPITFNLRSALENGEGLEIDPDTGLIEVWGVPAGFMRMSRAMLEKMVDAYPGTLFDIGLKDGRKMQAHALFDPYRVNGGTEKLGEDYAFCQRWRDIGGKVWIDPGVYMGHVGFKTFAGRLGEVLPKANEEAA